MFFFSLILPHQDLCALIPLEKNGDKNNNDWEVTISLIKAQSQSNLLYRPFDLQITQMALSCLPTNQVNSTYSLKNSRETWLIQTQFIY